MCGDPPQPDKSLKIDGVCIDNAYMGVYTRLSMPGQSQADPNAAEE